MTDKSPPSFKERLEWHEESGEIRDGDVRYLMLRHDALMGVFKQLPADACGEALAAFAQSIVSHGGKSARKYQAMGAQDGARLLAVIAQTAPQLGWGRWQIKVHDSRRIQIVVTNSPFAKGWQDATTGSADSPAPQSTCTPIVGMLAVVGQMIFDQPVLATETQCLAGGHHAHCEFSIEVASTGSESAA